MCVQGTGCGTVCGAGLHLWSVGECRPGAGGASRRTCQAATLVTEPRRESREPKMVALHSGSKRIFRRRSV